LRHMGVKTSFVEQTFSGSTLPINSFIDICRSCRILSVETRCNLTQRAVVTRQGVMTDKTSIKYWVRRHKRYACN
jgi:hypothetical protein